jgi:hypothetical protein
MEKLPFYSRGSLHFIAREERGRVTCGRRPSLRCSTDEVTGDAVHVRAAVQVGIGVADKRARMMSSESVRHAGDWARPKSILSSNNFSLRFSL